MPNYVFGLNPGIMKKFLILLLIVLSWQLTFGQDRIRMKSGDTYEVDIAKTNRNTVYFFRWGDADCGLDSLPKSYIQSIRYDARKLAVKKWSYAIGLGGTVLGSQNQLEEVLSQNAYDGTYTCWLTGKRVIYPHSNVFPAIMVETQYLRRDHQGLGVNLSLANVGETFGYHARWGNLLVRYENLSLSPFASFYSPRHIWQFRIGPMLNYSRVYRHDAGPDDNRDRQHYLRPGVYTGGSFALFENEQAYFRIMAEYRLSIGNLEVGPYREDVFGEPAAQTEVILASQTLNMRHGVVGLRYGRKF